MKRIKGARRIIPKKKRLEAIALDHTIQDCPTGKRSFNTRSYARGWAKEHSNQFGKKFRVYLCEKCNYFHLATKVVT